MTDFIAVIPARFASTRLPGKPLKDIAGKTMIERVYRHPKYQRVIRMSKKLKAHDEANESHVGDRVLIEETRPMSKEKRWRIRKVLSRVS